MARFVRHAFDIVNSQQLSGWCFSWLYKSCPLTLSFFLDDVKIGETVANIDREDLKELGVHPTGKCGFQFIVPRTIDLQNGTQFVVRVKGLPTILEQVECRNIPQVFQGELPKVFFMHIPKTAGTSFSTYARLFYPEGTAITHVQEEASYHYDSLGGEFQYLAGHLTLEKIVAAGFQGYYKFYTIIRNPYKHIHSHLNWVRGIGADADRGFFKKHHPVIQDLARRLNNSNKMEETLRFFVDNLDGFEIDFFDNIQTRYFLNYRPDRVSEQDLQNSIYNCELFEGIGLTERYDLFSQKFCADNDFQYVRQPKALNRACCTPLYDYQSPIFKEIIEPLIKFDVQLYDYVKSTL